MRVALRRWAGQPHGAARLCAGPALGSARLEQGSGCRLWPHARLEGDERNALYLVFVDPDHRRLLVDWEALARSSLAMFRADSARHAGDPGFERLAALLHTRSPEFRLWWPERELISPLTGRKRITHPRAGRMEFEYSSFVVGASPEMKLIVFTPLEQDSAFKLDSLLHL